MSRWGVLALVAATICSVACGGGGSPPGSPGPSGTDNRITGNERLGWTQAAPDAGLLARYSYVAYVDGQRNVLAGVNCTGAAAGSFQCSSRMPPMTPGAHTIELATVVDDTGNLVESDRSAPIRVTLTGATPGSDAPDAPSAHEQTTSDGVRLRAVTLAHDIEPPSAMAFAADGSAFLAERRGRITATSIQQMADSNFAAGGAALSIDGLYVTSDARGGLIDLVLDPEYDRTRFLYALYVVSGPDGVPQFEIARFREAGGRLGERTVLFDHLPASSERPAGALAFGPDGKLYAAFDDGGDPSRAGNAGAYNAKVLRLNPDGTTPSDRSNGSPVFSSAYRSPRGLDWQPSSNTLWMADRVAPNAEQLRMIAETVRLARGQSRGPIPLPATTDTSSMAFYRGDSLAPLHGDLLVAGADGLLRLRFDRRDGGRVVGAERLFADILDAVSVAVGPDGAVYLGAQRSLLKIIML